MKDIFLKLIFNTQKIYMTLKKPKGLLLIYMIKLSMFSYKKPKALYHGLAKKNVHRVTKFNQKAWQRPYIDTNTELKKSKKWLWDNFFKLMDNSVFRKTMENVQKRRNTKLVTTNGRRNHLLSKPNYHKQSFSQKMCWIKKG